MSAASSVPCGEELLHELVFALGHRLDELLVLGLGPLGQVGGNRPVGPLAVLEEMGLHADEVHGSLEALLLADGDLERHDLAAELLVERLHHAVERGALPVHPVDDEEDGALELGRELPGLLGLDLDARDGVEDEQRPRPRPPRPPSPRGKDAVSGRVQEVDPHVAVDGVGAGEVDRDLALELLAVEVRRASSFVDPAGPGQSRRRRGAARRREWFFRLCCGRRRRRCAGRRRKRSS